MFEGVESPPSTSTPGERSPSLSPKQEMHGTPFRAVFFTSHETAELYLRDLLLFSPHTPFFLVLPNVWHLRRLRAEKRFIKKRNDVETCRTLYKLPTRILTATREDAEALRAEVNPSLKPQVMPSLGQAGSADWLKALIKANPVRLRRKPAALQKTVSIVILCHNDGRYLQRCVESIKKHTRVPYELIFVDNASEDGSQKYLRSVKGAKVILNPSNLAFAKGNNQGVQIAQGDYILLLNADVVVTHGWLEGLLACAESNPNIGMVAPMTNSASNIQTVPVNYRSLKDLDRFALAMSIKYKSVWMEAHRIIGFCMLIKREVIRRVGLLDERFGPGGYEDYDYCLRVRQAGYRIMLCRGVFIHHFGGRGYVGMNYDRLRDVNRELFIEKWCRKSLEFLEEARL
jgi:hypothetical protein